MRTLWCLNAVSLLLSGLFLITLDSVRASPSPPRNDLRSPSLFEDLDIHHKRDGGHHHNTHAQPLLELNETEITLYHSPTPPSYYTLDWEDHGFEDRHEGMIIFHGIAMSFAFFVSLPIAIVLRSIRNPGHSLAMVSFYGFSALGCASGALYRKNTPNMYEAAEHSRQSYVILLIAVMLSILDIIAAIRRFITFLRGSDYSLKQFYATVVGNAEPQLVGPEYAGLASEELEEFVNSKLERGSESLELQDIPSTDHTDHECERTGQWANAVHRHQRHFSTLSERTLFQSRSPTVSDATDIWHSPRNLLHRIGEGLIAVVERSLVVAGWAQLLVGIVIYTGGCRENYLNGCLAHLIKGSIFWCYGLLTFARFLGSFADLGWAWNKPPGNTYSAEFVESFVIFLYGITNTWMERFGAHPGDPYTTKQIQHIGIAVMFWFAGLIGMAIESRRIRKWLASSTFSATSRLSDITKEAVIEPSSYSASFNPFPALVVGVTGAAMAAHFQTYLFQVQIHALWGNFLLGFSVLRCLTYFFLWLSPPKSILPSRPPTEALASFFLACGGLVFMFSTEEVTIAAMRRGRDDVMMFLNVAVAITCFAFCWILLVVSFKGYMKSKVHGAVTYRAVA